MAIFHKTLQYHEDTTEKRDISQEDIEFLKKLQLEMNTQDTTGTADPRFWVIKGSERVINNEDPDELCLQVDGSTVTSTTEETVKYLNDNILPDCNIDRGCKIETGYTWDFKLTYTEDGEEEYEDLSTQEVNEFLANNGHDNWYFDQTIYVPKHDVSYRERGQGTSGEEPLSLLGRCTYILYGCVEISGSRKIMENTTGDKMGLQRQRS